ncbi:type II toxin-antitoxin system RelE/ParE family toxin [Aridibaculum aurantiacum]|uniref:type II toxin-antitoxin system RelE/ParE family toxin n=1 Tax=Aridibaculum aurantiacum TaxID=2810307 RepID=UPI001A972F45|nr:type II toxin-antitoxin system RelE/ParE family toxin [Aridibaculum aurantiacum]
MSRIKIIFSAGALQDMLEAKQWYNQQQSGLGNRFQSDVEEVIKRIKMNPTFASIKFGSIRTAACSSFPYAVHYEYEELEKLVRIISIFHFSRKPYWMD